MSLLSFQTDYQAVPASTTAVITGQSGIGVKGDILSKIILIPTTTSPGAVQIKDGGGTAITLFVGGATSLSDLKPFEVVVGQRSILGAWSVITGANIAVLVNGRFQ